MESHEILSANNDILGGAVVFMGTRVPVDTLFDYLETNHTLDEFLDDFPTVARRQAEGVLEVSKHLIGKANLEAAA
jgi:uncharacterized protein (DUF433 family)